MITTCLSRGSARHEVHAIDLRIKKGQRRPSRLRVLSAVTHLANDLKADAWQILSQERMGYDEFQVTILLFWRADADPS